MSHLLDSSTLMVVIAALIPNLMVMLWIMARMHRDIRIVSAKLGMLEADNKLLDEELNELSEELRQLRQNTPRTPPPVTPI